MRIRHPKVADQIKTGERRYTEPPIMPRVPETPERGSDQETVEMYKIQVQIYPQQMTVYNRAQAALATRPRENQDDARRFAV